MDERQSLETLTRDEKTAQRVLAQLKDKQTQLDQKKESLSEDARVQENRKSEVLFVVLLLSSGLTACSWKKK